MKVIIHEGVKHFRNNRRLPSDESHILKYIRQHSFYHQSLPLDQITRQIKQKIKRSTLETNEIKGKLEQLSLYLNNQKNKSIFQIYAIVLKNPSGITYKDIDSKVKIGIVSVSHYCCRLKKMNFVELKHEKNEKVVFPKGTSAERKPEEEDQQKITKKDACMPFHFHELSMLDNIWINVSSFDSYKSNGITNEDIKQRLNKTSQTKLIMKMVDQAKVIFNFEKQMVSEGKVFENKFKNVTKQIASISVDEIVEDNDTEQKLKPKIQNWLRNKFVQYSGQKFLFDFINNQLKDYFSVSGIRSARRTCTPIKLTRYIKILNKLNESWPQTHIQLKNFIIEQEKQIQNGLMHKRSILGILDGLVSKNILKKVEHERQSKEEEGQKMAQFPNKVEIYYYPLWEPDSKQKSRKLMEETRLELQNAKKNKNHLASLKTDGQVGNKISLKEYRMELKVRFLQAALQQIYAFKLKQAFKRIFYAKRAKTVIKSYEPQTHIFYLLQDQNYKKAPQIKAQNYENFIHQVDQFVESEGIKQDQINVNYEVIKIFRKSDKANEFDLRARFGNSWAQKIQPMVGEKMIEESSNGVWILKEKERYFV